MKENLYYVIIYILFYKNHLNQLILNLILNKDLNGYGTVAEAYIYIYMPSTVDICCRLLL